MKPAVQKDGFCTVQLSREGTVYPCMVHRLVATAFVDNPNGYRYVRHKDRNRQNNTAENLEWYERK